MRRPLTDRRLQVLLLAPWFYPDSNGGAPRVFDTLARNASRIQITVLADHPHGVGAESDESTDFPYRVVRADFPNPMSESSQPFARKVVIAAALMWRQHRAVASTIRQLQPDVIIAGNVYVCGWMRRWFQRRTVWANYVHGEELTMALSYGPLSSWLWRKQRDALQKANLNICVSGNTARVTRDLYGVDEERIAIVPNPVDLSRFNPPADRDAARADLGWDGKFILLTIARLVPRKGIDRTLRALHVCKNLPSNWLYCIGGLGQEMASLQGLVAELGLQERVRFLGSVPEVTLADHYGAADLFVQTNVDVNGDTEGFGIVFLEASACGTAVLGGISGGTADAIEDGVSGYRVDGDDIEQVRDRLELLCTNDGLRATLAAGGLARARREFSPAVCTNQLEDRLLALM
jgi:phosphatidylinositol alpha-1,6-mannosyltransferase